MAVQKLYPRSTVKRIVKAHSKKNISKNADVMVLSCHATSRSPFHSIADKDAADLSGLCSLSTNVGPAPLMRIPIVVDVDFRMASLVLEASIYAKQNGERGISTKGVRKTTEVSDTISKSRWPLRP
jgi:hypothetical protein